MLTLPLPFQALVKHLQIHTRSVPLAGKGLYFSAEHRTFPSVKPDLSQGTGTSS